MRNHLLTICAFRTAASNWVRQLPVDVTALIEPSHIGTLGVTQETTRHPTGLYSACFFRLLYI